MAKRLDLKDKEFGRLKVLYERPERSKHGTIYWVCQCSCGNIKEVAGYKLKSGNTTSCGCYNRDIMTTHGKSYSLEYGVWKMMIARLSNPRNKSYNHYGGSGIKGCDFILYSVDNLVSVVGHRPSKQFSLDRIDNSGHYSCGHCQTCIDNGWLMNLRWATQKAQTRNTSKNRILTLNGESHCVAEWAEILNVSYKTLFSRLNRGWSDEKTLTEPIGPSLAYKNKRDRNNQ